MKDDAVESVKLEYEDDPYITQFKTSASHITVFIVTNSFGYFAQRWTPGS